MNNLLKTLLTGEPTKNENWASELRDLHRKIEALNLKGVEITFNHQWQNFQVTVNGKMSFVAMTRDLAEAFIFGVYRGQE